MAESIDISTFLNNVCTIF